MSTHPPLTAQVLADAAARRVSCTGASASGAQHMDEYEKRQTFRRLIDPGIFRPNSKQVAMDALKTLSTMAENILREPDKEKYRSFKRENNVIKRRLIEPRGALEYAIELGFRPKVDNFQSCYVFNPTPSRMAELCIGAAILREAIDHETEREERAQRDKEQQKAATAAAVQNVKLAFLDDRKRKMLCDEREREAREAREAARGSQSDAVPLPPLSTGDRTPSPMPGVGHTLADTIADQPPPYDDDD